MDERQLARGLGWFSLGLGLMEVAAPQRVSRGLGLRGKTELVRLFGLREMASGLGLLNGGRPDRWVKARVAGDAMDLALLSTALAPNNPRRGAAVTAMAAVVGATALDVLCSRNLDHGKATPINGPLHVERSITIDRPPEDLYRFWRNFETLPRIMNHLISVLEFAPGRSHWVARGPGGLRLEWDAEITADRPNELIAWCSLEGADVDNAGCVRFEPARGGRGTVVRVEMDYQPPAGMIGATIARLFGESPDKQVAVDLHRLKQLMETGEIARTLGQPAGAGRERGISKKYDEFVRT
jgi:uncharacterized membrane protein